MDDRLIQTVSVMAAVLAAASTFYFRFVRGWAMSFGPMILVGLGTPTVLGVFGAVVAKYSPQRNRLVALNMAGIALGIIIGYVV